MTTAQNPLSSNFLKMQHPRGHIELIIGPMFAGKSTELLRRMRRYEVSGKKCLHIKFAEDTRYDSECISTHDQQKKVAIQTNKLQDRIFDALANDVVGIDEGQFFSDVSLRFHLLHRS